MPDIQSFVRTYNQLDDALRSLVGARNKTRFQNVLDDAARVSERVAQEKEWIETVAEIRNAVVHGRHWPTEDDPGFSHPVAASDGAVTKMNGLIEAIQEEPRALLEVASRTPEVFSADTPLAELLSFMGEHDYSQVIVRENEKLSLLTAEGVARWFELNLDDNGHLLMTDETAGNALEHDLPDHHKVWPRDRLIADAHTTFSEHLSKGRPRIFAILITESGARDETPLGIVTPWDLF